MSSAPTFGRQQLRLYQLAGTVALPSPYPELGRLSLIPGGLKYGDDDEGDGIDLVAVEHRQSSRVTITRYVALDDVKAVLFTTGACPAQLADGDWYFGPEVARTLEARSNDNDPSLCMGILYARESAPVIMRVEAGMTAAESAEYYPPVVGERSDAHYIFSKKVITDCSAGYPCS
jgi:hypothetical protein